jgi:hypothetical protein
MVEGSDELAQLLAEPVTAAASMAGIDGPAAARARTVVATPGYSFTTSTAPRSMTSNPVAVGMSSITPADLPGTL